MDREAVQPPEDRGGLPDRNDGGPVAKVDPRVDADRAAPVRRAHLDQDATVAGDDRPRQRDPGSQRGLLEGDVGAGPVGDVRLGAEHLLERPAPARRLEPPDPAHLTAGGDLGLGQNAAESECVGHGAGIRWSRGDGASGHPGQGSEEFRCAAWRHVAGPAWPPRGRSGPDATESAAMPRDDAPAIRA